MDVQRLKNAAHTVHRNGFADARLDALRVDVDDAVVKGGVSGLKGVVARDFGIWEDALDQGPGQFQSFGAEARINAALIAKRGVGIEAVALGAFTDHDGVKPGRFQDNGRGIGLYARF